MEAKLQYEEIRPGCQTCHPPVLFNLLLGGGGIFSLVHPVTLKTEDTPVYGLEWVARMLDVMGSLPTVGNVVRRIELA
ncbi:hypothetical protein KIN20_023218 [Parelaphostrongylus tenuis]|uniref:Uncharacterized protein n=1 Tax=Parelaphostrongylus tenuis TaxID=148309 RepID=A0AAD5QVR2_PARTN|nr:hypothetical protein KIN20_023218 [Parelaphostrongylus tenuis]